MVSAPIVLEEGYVKMYLKGRPVTMYMPKDQVDSYCLESRGELPSSKLKLDWVYPFYLKRHAAGEAFCRNKKM